MVAPSPRYAAGGLHALLFGGRYRSLWTTPVPVAVLNLDTLGGLRVVRPGGFGQTMSLHFADRNGLSYVFRSVDKDPSRGLPEELRGTVVESVQQDQVSALHPYAALVVAPLLAATGILHASPQLLLMPDDERLGLYGDEFAGMLGLFEARPDEGPADSPGFQEFDKIVSTENLFERLEPSPRQRVHARAFLAARLMDVYLGDRDRHTDQWRWAGVTHADGVLWEPIPRDRDQAFVGFAGLMMTLVRTYRPQFVPFGEDYTNINGAIQNAWALDRRLLAELDAAVWDSVAAALQTALTDSVIEGAVRAQPEPAYRLNGAALARALQRRRDTLRDMAARYYRILAEYPDVHATDEDEIARIERLEDGAVRLMIATVRDPERPYFERTFHPRETREIRIFLQGGDDRVVVAGMDAPSIRVRVIGGGGDDTLVGGPVDFYQGRNHDSADERFAPPPLPSAFAPPHRNWGSWSHPVVWLSSDPDLGLTIGGGVAWHRYAFRKPPYEYRLSILAAYATSKGLPRVSADLRLPALAPDLEGRVRLRAPGIGVTRFHGFGNESPAGAPDAFDIDQLQFELAPSVAWRVAPNVRLNAGMVAKVVHTDSLSATVLDSFPPYGAGTFKQLGGQVGLELDTRDQPIAPLRGAVLDISLTGFPAILSADAGFFRLSGQAAGYVTAADLPGRPTLALHAGGERVWGDFPFFEAAFVGGDNTARGYPRDRFAGTASLYGNAEVRLFLGRVLWILPTDVGVFGLGDAGRVFFPGENSDRWHGALGTGIWIAPIERANTFSLAVARGHEGTAVYARAAFMY
ncbi:MAG: BamA/TamA family outer membrane protein [Gemmatimonadetes bacterium]|nr:BamA/TamA family outer membrane protein [Gemmatimonadota bacterium]